MAKYHPARIQRTAPAGQEYALAERLLWNEIRVLREDGFQFRRRVLIDGNTVDFFCLKACLVVRLEDPSGKNDLYDAKLRRLLENQGFGVLQLSCDAVVADARAAGIAVFEVCEQRLEVLPATAS